MLTLETHGPGLANLFAQFYVMLNAHLSIILVNDQFDTQFFFLYVYFNSLQVLSNLMFIIRRINCINTTCAKGEEWIAEELGK
jgi:hypothetical protein